MKRSTRSDILIWAFMAYVGTWQVFVERGWWWWLALAGAVVLGLAMAISLGSKDGS